MSHLVSILFYFFVCPSLTELELLGVAHTSLYTIEPKTVSLFLKPLNE